MRITAGSQERECLYQFHQGAISIQRQSTRLPYAACDLVQWYDTGLYHLQAVQWSTHYPAVPGLANLHYRLGYNNSVHLFAAYTDAFWEGVAAHIANGFLLLVVLCQWFSEIFFARTPTPWSPMPTREPFLRISRKPAAKP